MRGWNLRLIGLQREAKENISKRIQDLDRIAEGRLLSIQKWEEWIELENNLENISRNEELFGEQRAGTKWIL